MRRHVGGSIEAFEALVTAAAAGEADVAQAEYPPGAEASCGPLRLRVIAQGAVIVEVEPGGGSWGDFRLDMLFARGSCVFGRADDLRSFWNGAVARAFGLDANPETEAVTTLAEELCEQLPDRPQAAVGTRLRKKPRRLTAAIAPPVPGALARGLAARVHGQDEAVSRIATVTAVHLAKRAPRRPAVICLLGPTGVGKTSAIEALPDALAEAGWSDAHVHRVDCGEIATHGDVSRLIGAPPGYVGCDKLPPVYRALGKPGCILLLDELEKGHDELRRTLVSFLDNGTLRAPMGRRVESGRAIVAMTTNADADQLASRLHRIDPGNRAAIDATCREHLREAGWTAELVARIDAMAVFAPLPADALQQAADQAIRAQAREFGLDIRAVEPVLADVVVDLSLARGAGARGLDHAARDLLGEQLAAAVREGIQGRIDVLTGPPPSVVGVNA